MKMIMFIVKMVSILFLSINQIVSLQRIVERNSVVAAKTTKINIIVPMELESKQRLKE